MAAIENRIVIEEAHDVTHYGTAGPVTGTPVRTQDAKAGAPLALSAEIKPTQSFNGYGSAWYYSKENRFPILSPSDLAGNHITTNGDGWLHLQIASGATANIGRIPASSFPGTFIIKKSETARVKYVCTSGISRLVIDFITRLQNDQTHIAIPERFEVTELSGEIELSTSQMLEDEETLEELQISIFGGSEDGCYFLFSLTDEDIPVSNICPVSGEESTTFSVSNTGSASDASTFTASFPSPVYGGSFDAVSGKLEANSVNLSVDSTFSGTSVTVASGTKWILATDALPGTNLASNYLQVVSSEQQDATNWFTVAEDNGTIYAMFGALTTLEDVQTFLGLNPLQVVYQTTTSTESQLTPLSGIEFRKGTNYVWADTGDVTLTYTTETVVREYTPLMEFQNDAIISVDSDTSVSLVGEELYINQFEATVDYYVWVPYLFKPTDYDGFQSSGGMLLCSRKNYDLRLLPYGSRITFWSGGLIAGVFYSKNVERVQRAWYKIKAVSAIGLLDAQYHRGGIYTGQFFQDVLAEIMGDAYNYVVDGDVATQRVYGWLPFDTKRKNLYQMLLAYGVEIVLGDNGAMQFTFPTAERAIPIPADRVFQGGKVIYDEPASQVEINEHSYHYDPTVEEVTLFDNSSDEAVTEVVVIFDEPIYPASIRCSSGNLTISITHTNYAVVSGSGILSGIPYVHNIRLISNTNPNGAVEKVVRVEDATLVTFVNADNVLRRLSEYYFNATRVEQDIKVVGEKPGLLYTTQNPFGELMTGYIARMSKSVTSFARATCRFIQNYTPVGTGQSYTDRVVIPLGSGARVTWTIPQEVFAKETPAIRVVLIGKGQDGEPGADGEYGISSGTNVGRGKGGAGGLGGAGGIGGNILIVTINVSGIPSISLANSGDDSVLTSSIASFSSADGAPNNFGYYDILTGDIYAYPGIYGVDGAAGGDGDLYTHTTGEESSAQPGGDVEYLGTLYTGGEAGGRAIVRGSSVGVSGNLRIYVSACGGGAAAAGENGEDATGYISVTDWGDPGDGADAVPASPPSAGYGNGGNGGNGGGGGGAGAGIEWYNHVYNSVIGTESSDPGKGGKGSSGSAGNYGCAIIYY